MNTNSLFLAVESATFYVRSYVVLQFNFVRQLIYGTTQIRLFIYRIRYVQNKRKQA